MITNNKAWSLNPALQISHQKTKNHDIKFPDHLVW